MEVSVIYREQEYRYVEFCGRMTWVDASQIAVPVMLHTVLREHAIASGINSSVFVSTPDEIEANKVAVKEQKIKEKKVSKISKNKKKNLLGGFNPFKKGV